MNIEKALGFEERVQDLNLHREKMELDLLTSNSQLRYQHFILKNYQEIAHEKAMLKRDMVAEMEGLRRDRLDARRAILETRNAREELEVERKKAAMDRRHQEGDGERGQKLPRLQEYGSAYQVLPTTSRRFRPKSTSTSTAHMLTVARILPEAKVSREAATETTRLSLVPVSHTTSY